MSTDTNVDITLTLIKGSLLNLLSKTIEYNCNHFEKKFKLYAAKNTTNMHLFDEKQQMKRYKTVESIVDDYYPIRYALYQKRKDYLVNILKEEVQILHNKARFIEEMCQDNLFISLQGILKNEF